MNTTSQINSLIIEGKNSVTGGDRGTQFYFANQEALEIANFEIGAKFKSTTTDKNELILELVDDPKEGNGTVSNKSGNKRIIDTRKLPDNWAKGMKLKIVATKRKIIITLHCTEAEVSERETEIKDRFINNENIKIGEMFAGNKMRKMLRENGLVNLANDCSCKLAIEVEPNEIQKSLNSHSDFWQEKSYIACKDIHHVDFSSIELEKVDGLIADLTMLNKIGDKKPTDAIDENDEKLSVYFLSFFEVLRRTNPAFVIAEVNSDEINKAKKSPILSVLEGVFESLSYNCKIEIEEGDITKAKVVALSKNLSLDELASQHIEYTSQKYKINDRHFIKPSNYINERTLERESRVKSKILNNEDIEIGSCFSGGGIADAASHEGFLKSNINSFCKYGFEIEEKYSASNLRNNKSIWNDKSNFVIGDIAQVNPYDIFDYRAEGNISGVPCVGASVAGISKNGLKFPEEHKLAGKLFVSYLCVIKATNPAYTTLENVRGFMKSFSMNVIRGLMSFYQYNISQKLMDGIDYGAIENRKRFVMVCMSKNIFKNNILDEVEHTPNHEQKLGDALLDIKHSDKSWKWYDYLDQKSINDKAKGNDFAQQFVNKESKTIGVISKGYKKCRSTEPFLVWDLQQRFSEYHLNSQSKENINEVCSEIFKIPDIPEMVINFAQTAINRHNLRNKLKAVNKVKSKLAEIMQNALLTKSLNNVGDIIHNSEELHQELIETLSAMSKATRILYVVEHSKCKKVPPELVENTSETTGHEILGNGVIFTLFIEIAKTIGNKLKKFAFGEVTETKFNHNQTKASKTETKEEKTFEQLEFLLTA